MTTGCCTPGYTDMEMARNPVEDPRVARLARAAEVSAATEGASLPRGTRGPSAKPPTSSNGGDSGAVALDRGPKGASIARRPIPPHQTT